MSLRAPRSALLGTRLSIIVIWTLQKRLDRVDSYSTKPIAEKLMFKIIALIGAIAGGTTYGLYAHTDLFGDKCHGNCPLAAKSCCNGNVNATPSCCVTPCPDCAKGCDECCDVCDLCCGAATAVAVSTKTNGSAGFPACCSDKTTLVSAKKAACCADPCPSCTPNCEACCPACPTVCGACCGVSAKAAVAGPAAVVAGAVKK